VTLPYLRRQLRFAAILAVNCAHSVAQFSCSITLALLGFGYLSLAWAAVAGTVAALLTSVWLRPRGLPWLPARRGVRQILHFGMYSTAGAIVDELGVGAPDLVIGKMIGLAEVGLFGKAVGVLGIFNQLITSAVSPVVFPMFSARVRDGQDLRQVYLATAGHMAALAWPFFGFVALTAPALLQLLYGPQWAAAVPLIRIMCLSSALYSMFSMARYLFVAMGHVRAQARLDAIAVPVRVVALVAAAPFGLEALAWAVVLGALFRSAMTYLFLARLVRLEFAALLWAMRHSAIVAVAGVAGAALGQWWLPMGAGAILLPLAASALLSAVSWLAALFWTKHALAAECALVGRRLLGLPG
jgi:O-antigen/teichoic acid export membrane protein